MCSTGNGMHGVRNKKSVDNCPVHVTKVGCVGDEVSRKQRLMVEERWERGLTA